jgi:hypothetical protein
MMDVKKLIPVAAMPVVQGMLNRVGVLKLPFPTGGGTTVSRSRAPT